MSWEVNPDSNRVDALFRVLLLLYLFTLYAIVAAIGLIAGLIFMVIDVLMQLIFGDAGYGGGGNDGFIGNWGMRLFVWPLDQLKYIALGTGDGFPILP